MQNIRPLFALRDAAPRAALCVLLCVALAFLQIQLGLAVAAQKHEFELSNDKFVSSAFDGTPPNPQRVWIRGPLREKIEKILGHPVSFIRTKYWAKNERSVWILEEIGKDKLITVGHIVDHSGSNSKLSEVKVLAFRESRGWEVKFPFFTEQFIGVMRKQNHRGLNRSIDGITGATLSVRALKKLAEIALLLDEHVRETEKTNSNKIAD